MHSVVTHLSPMMVVLLFPQKGGLRSQRKTEDPTVALELIALIVSRQHSPRGALGGFHPSRAVHKAYISF